MILIKLIPGIKNILRRETLNDDVKNGAIRGLVIGALVCVAMMLFSR